MVAMSDHLLLEVVYDLHEAFNVFQIPKPETPSKICPEVVKEADFCSKSQHGQC